jgi:hypothetical protein
MTRTIARRPTMPATDVTATEPTAVETYELWARHRQALEEKTQANAQALAEVTADLEAARRAAILAPDDGEVAEAVGQGIIRQRLLEAERDEIAERLVVARAEEQTASGPAREALRAQQWAGLVDEMTKLESQLEAKESEINDLVARLMTALADRWALDAPITALLSQGEQLGAPGGGFLWQPGATSKTAPAFEPYTLPAYQAEKRQLMPGDQPVRSRYHIEV